MSTTDKIDHGGQTVSCAVQLFNEGWNLLLTLESLPVNSENIARRRNNQIDRFKKRASESLSEMGLEAVDFSGQKYTPELPVSVMNLGDFSSSDELRILKMKRLTIKMIGSTKIIQSGIAIVEKII